MWPIWHYSPPLDTDAIRHFGHLTSLWSPDLAGVTWCPGTPAPRWATTPDSSASPCSLCWCCTTAAGVRWGRDNPMPWLAEECCQSTGTWRAAYEVRQVDVEWWMRVCVCMSVFVYECVCGCACVYECLSVYVCFCICVCRCVWVWVCVCVIVSVCVSMSVYLCVCNIQSATYYTNQHDESNQWV